WGGSIMWGEGAASAASHAVALRRRPRFCLKNSASPRKTSSRTHSACSPLSKEHRMANPLQRLIEFGQSFWLDNIRRGFTRAGELKRLIDDDSLRGGTSN